MRAYLYPAVFRWFRTSSDAKRVYVNVCVSVKWACQRRRAMGSGCGGGEVKVATQSGVVGWRWGLVRGVLVISRVANLRSRAVEL